MSDMTDFEDLLTHIVERGCRETADEWMQNIETEYGRTPLIFKRMSERPEVLISHLLYKGSVAKTSSLDPKYVELISLAVGAALRCQHLRDTTCRPRSKKVHPVRRSSR